MSPPMGEIPDFYDQH